MNDFVAPGFKRGEEYTLPTGLTDHGVEILREDVQRLGDETGRRFVALEAQLSTHMDQGFFRLSKQIEAIVITGVTSGRIVVESVEDHREKCRRGEHAAPKEHHVVTFPNGTTWACCPVCGCALINGRPDGPKV